MPKNDERCKNKHYICTYYTKIIELHSSQSAPVVDGKVMEFVIFAIESAAQKLGIPAPTLYNRLEKLNLIRQYLISGYDMLHTQSREYIADTLVEALENWEAHYKEKGESV